MRRLFQNTKMIVTLVVLGAAAAAHFLLPAIYQSNLDRFAANLMERSGAKLTYAETKTGLLGTSFMVNDVSIDGTANTAPLKIDNLFFNVTVADYLENLGGLLRGRGIQKVNYLTMNNALLPLGSDGGQIEAVNIIVSRLNIPAAQALVENGSKLMAQQETAQLEQLPFQSLEILAMNLTDSGSIITLDELRFNTVGERLYDISIAGLDSDITVNQGAAVSFKLGSLEIDDFRAPQLPDSLADMSDLDPNDPEDRAKILSQQQEFLQAYAQLYVKSFSLKDLRAKSDLLFDFSIKKMSYDILDGRMGPQNIYLPFKTNAEIEDLKLILGPIGAIVIKAISPDLPTSLQMNGSGQTTWNPETGSYQAASSLTLDGLLSMALEFDLGGITEQTLVDYLEFGLAAPGGGDETAPVMPDSFGRIGIRDVSFELEDLGAVDIAYTIAETQGIPKDVAPALLKAQIAANADVMAEQTPEVEEISQALLSFIDGSKTLKINLAPSEPVTLSQLQPAEDEQAEVNPFDRLGFTIETE